MSKIEEPLPDSLQLREFLQDYHRRNMEEIRSAVTRGAAGIEASYFCDQEVLLGLAREAGERSS
jgi:hypothetical protein